MCNLDVGICLVTSGVAESSTLNRVCGIRAAVVHSEYIAGMCRLVFILI